MKFLHSLKHHVLLCLALLTLALPAVGQTMVRLHTTQGAIDYRLLDSEAPLTVANFLAYVRAGTYAGTLVHRSVPGFVIQGGGYAYGSTGIGAPHIPTNAPVQNEFSAQRSNVRGTVAMAKLGGNPNSATSEWFVNLANNGGGCAVSSTNLDCQNGGFTVFARVTVPGMAVVDRIAALPRCNCTAVSSAATDMPVASTPVTADNVRQLSVVVTRVTELPTQTDHDRIFNWAEATYPQFVASSPTETGTQLGYTYRFYAATGAYLGVKDGNVYYYVPAINGQINLAGTVANLLAVAAQAGY